MWGPGDQAMCIRALPDDPRMPPGWKEPILRDDPVPPAVYEVVDVRPIPPPPPGMQWDPNDVPPCYLKLRGKPYSYDCRFFRKLEPLDPELIDLPERIPEPA